MLPYGGMDCVASLAMTNLDWWGVWQLLFGPRRRSKRGRRQPEFPSMERLRTELNGRLIFVEGVV
jgi:hypothetical protein